MTRNTRGPAYRAGDSSEPIFVPFTWAGVEYLVPAREFRHLHADCPGLIAVQRAGGWVDRVENNMELRARTVRCTAGCWDDYERTEENQAAKGDAARKVDREIDGIERRSELAARIDQGRVTGAERLQPDSSG